MAVGVNIVDESGVAELKDSWNRLNRSMHRPNVFLTWEWVTRWIECYGGKYEIRIFVVRDQDTVRAILPLARMVNESWKSAAAPAKLVFCGSLELGSDQLDIIAPKDSDALLYIDMIVKCMVGTKERWDLLLLNNMAADGNLLRYFRGRGGFRTLHHGREKCPYLHLEDCFDAFDQKLKRKKRYNLKRERKILLAQGNVRLRSISDPDEIEGCIGDLFSLHHMRANSKGIASAFAGSDLKRFHKAITLEYAKSGITQMRERKKLLKCTGK